MTSDHQEVIERLQFIAAQAQLAIRDIRKGVLYNTPTEIMNMQTQLTTISAKVNNYGMWTTPNDL